MRISQSALSHIGPFAQVGNTEEKIRHKGFSKMAEDSDRKRASSDNEGEHSNDEEVVENGYDDEPDFSDPEGFVDDISDEDLLGDILATKPRETDGVDTVIVVDGVPQVGPDRLDKLKNVLKKIFIKFGDIVTEYYPADENGKTKGFIFLEYASKESALEALKKTNGYRLDKQHVFTVNLFTDFDKYKSIPDEWTPPKPQPYTDHGNLRYWMLDPDCYDQYSVIYEGGEKTAVYLNSSPQPTLLEERKGWTETCVAWSPLGTYLATFHKRGIAFWGGENFKQITKFSHPRVQFIDFSPCEKYLVTFSSLPDSTRDDPHAIIIWDIRTGAKKRSFHADPHQTTWPVFKWSHDDKYFARMGQDILTIYETPSFGMWEKRSLSTPGIRSFSWSPTDNIIAFWVAENRDVPARVTLLEIPSKTELRAKKLFNVADCKMHWQKNGDHLCVKVDRYSKAKKEKNEWKYSGLYCNFEVFHMREKQIPIDSIEIKENITAFAWEPIGNKFAIIHGDNPNISVSFYGIKPGGTVTQLKKFERKQCNTLFWSPAGQFIVLAGLRGMNGTLEFVDTSDFTIVATSEHYKVTDVEWDPTGRYVVTGVSWWAHQVDNAYYVWSFQGRLLRRHPIERFCQLLWRPRLPSPLTEEKIKEIKKNLKKYSAQFDIKDRMTLSKASEELIEKRKKMMEEYLAYRKRREEAFLEQKEQRMMLRENIDTDTLDNEAVEVEEEVVEFFVNEEVTVLEGEE